jgi:hypothetical protein
MTLTFVQAYELFSVYRRDDGTRAYVEHGGMEPWTLDWDQQEYQAIWEELNDDYTLTQFQALVRATSDEPYIVISLCADCSEIDHEGTNVDGRGFICEPCLSDCYTYCDYHSGYVRSHDITIVNDDCVCERCCENYTFWCDDCDERYHNDYRGDHHHGGYDCCDSPVTSFAVQNNGDGALRNDTRATVSLPAGVITPEGMLAIYNWLRQQDQWDAAQIAYRAEPEWQTKQGNFTKRLSRALYKQQGIKLEPAVMSHIGNIAREHSTPVHHDIEVTRQLNLGPEEFAHEESCWWQSYFESRCALKTNGGYGLRSFDEDDNVTGRAWVMPLRLTEGGTLVPTFETLDPDAFIVFNGYGKLGGYVPARIVAHMAGMTYRKVDLSLDPMYVNSDSGYLVAPEEIAEPYTDGSYSVSMEQHSSLYHQESTRAKKKEMAHA